MHLHQLHGQFDYLNLLSIEVAQRLQHTREQIEILELMGDPYPLDSINKAKLITYHESVASLSIEAIELKERLYHLSLQIRKETALLKP